MLDFEKNSNAFHMHFTKQNQMWGLSIRYLTTHRHYFDDFLKTRSFSDKDCKNAAYKMTTVTPILYSTAALVCVLCDNNPSGAYVLLLLLLSRTERNNRFELVSLCACGTFP